MATRQLLSELLADEKTEVPTLRALCVGVLAERFDQIESFDLMDPSLYAEILAHRRCQASPAAVARVEEKHPELETAETDEAFWRKKCASEPSLMPFALQVKYAIECKEELEEEMRTRRHLTLGACAKRLSRFPMTTEVLAASKIGKTFAKFATFVTCTGTALNLVREWREAATEPRNVVESDDDDLAFYRKRIAGCHTWKAVYALICDHMDDKMRRFRLVAEQLYAQSRRDKPRTQLVTEPPPSSSKKKRQKEDASPRRPVAFQNVSRSSSTKGARASSSLSSSHQKSNASSSPSRLAAVVGPRTSRSTRSATSPSSTLGGNAHNNKRRTTLPFAGPPAAKKRKTTASSQGK